MEKAKAIRSSNIGIMTVLPLKLNIVMTLVIALSAVSLTEFLKSPTYYIYEYRFMLWSVYHVFLASLAYWFLKIEKESLKEIVGSIGDKLGLSITTIVGLVGLSVLVFQKSFAKNGLSELSHNVYNFECFVNC